MPNDFYSSKKAAAPCEAAAWFDLFWSEAYTGFENMLAGGSLTESPAFGV